MIVDGVQTKLSPSIMVVHDQIKFGGFHKKRSPIEAPQT